MEVIEAEIKDLEEFIELSKDNSSELDEIKNQLINTEQKISYRQKLIKCGRESCNSCPHGPYWYAEWSENGKRSTKYLGKILNEIS